MSDRADRFVVSGGNEIRKLLHKISNAASPADIGQCLEGSKFAREFPIYGTGIHRLDGVPIKRPIFTREIMKSGLFATDLPDEWRWTVCTEGEELMRPFDMLSHEFVTGDGSILAPLRQMAKAVGFKQIMVIPLQIMNTITITIVNFPNGDFDQQAKTVLSEIHQLVFAIFERFPALTKWPDEYRLTMREREVLELTAVGLTEAEISFKLGISSHTVRNHIQSCKQKLDARSKTHAVAIAMSQQEIALDDPK